MIGKRFTKQELSSLSLFLCIYLFQFFRYLTRETLDPTIVHLLLLSAKLFLISIFIFNAQKNNRRFAKLEFFIITFLIISIFSLFSRLFMGLTVGESFLSLITDLTSFLMMVFHYNLARSSDMSTEFKRLLLDVFSAITLFLLIFSVVFQRNEFKLLFTSTHAYASNISSIFLNRNLFGYYLFLFLLVYLQQSVYYKNRFGLLRYWIFFLLVLLFIFFTLSRTSISSTFIWFFLYVATEMKLKKINRHKIIIFYVFCLALIVFLYFFNTSPDFQRFLLNKVIRSEYSTTGRTSIWQVGIENFRENPFFGIGSFAANNTINHLHFHNLYIEILVRNGIFGFLLKVMIFLLTISFHLKKSYIDPTLKKKYVLAFIPIFWSFFFESHFLYKVNFRAILFSYIFFVLTL